MRRHLLSALSFVSGILFCFGAVIVLLNGFGVQNAIIATVALVSLLASVCLLVQYFFAKEESIRSQWGIWSIISYAFSGILLFGCISSPLMQAADLTAAFSIVLGMHRIGAFLPLKQHKSSQKWGALLFGALSVLSGSIYYFLPVLSGYLLNFFIALFLILEGIYCGSIWLFAQQNRNA